MIFPALIGRNRDPIFCCDLLPYQIVQRSRHYHSANFPAFTSTVIFNRFQTSQTTSPHYSIPLRRRYVAVLGCIKSFLGQISVMNEMNEKLVCIFSKMDVKRMCRRGRVSRNSFPYSWQFWNSCAVCLLRQHKEEKLYYVWDITISLGEICLEWRFGKLVLKSGKGVI